MEGIFTWEPSFPAMPAIHIAGGRKGGWRPNKKVEGVTKLATPSTLFYAPDWTRTSMPVKAQALNLPCIPIPPQGHMAENTKNYCIIGKRGCQAHIVRWGVHLGSLV